MRSILVILIISYCSCKTVAVTKAINNEISYYKLEKLDTLVDIGCGDGFHDRWIAHNYPDLFLLLEDMPFDLQNHELKKWITNNFKNNSFTPNIESHFRFISGLEESIPLPSSSFKRILCRKTLHEFSNRQKMVSELKRILMTGGILTIVEAEPKYDGEIDNYCKKKYLSKKEILSSFESCTLVSDTILTYPKGRFNVLNFTK